MSEQIKGIKLSTTAAQMSQNVAAFVIIKLDTNSMVSLQADANLMQLTFMKEALQDFVSKLMNPHSSVKLPAGKG